MARKNPVERMSSSTSSRRRAGQGLGRRVGREEAGRDHVHPLVGALGRQDGGHEKLERPVVAQGAQLGGRPRVLARPAGPTTSRARPRGRAGTGHGRTDYRAALRPPVGPDGAR